MALISLRDVYLGFGGPWLLEAVNLQIERHERVCLLGRNGAGKSSLLKVINGDLAPDRGAVWRSQAVRTAYLSQAVPLDLNGSVHDVVARGLPSVTAADAWRRSHQIEKVLSQVGLDASAESGALSAGLGAGLGAMLALATSDAAGIASGRSSPPRAATKATEASAQAVVKITARSTAGVSVRRPDDVLGASTHPPLPSDGRRL